MNKQKFVESITNMENDFSQWYTDIVKKAELIDYSSIRGCMVLKPYGYAIWEQIQKELDFQFKETEHTNVYFPMLIPESLLQKEKDHIEGFAPEVAWITQGGDENLVEKLCIRPTSEVLFCEYFAKNIQSYRDLPKLYNQWCSVVRWEKTTRPFLRTMEFLWQEGHTAHATEKEAEEEALNILNLYANFFEKTLAIPVIKGKKTEKEKFAGAKETYTIESLMHDGRALQSATTHNFSDKFAKAFGIQYTDKDNKLKYAYQTSWGLSTRSIGALIMVHSDNNGLILPPNIAPIQIAIIPIAQHKEGVIDSAQSLKERLCKNFRTKIDISDKSPGWKFSEYEMKGIPLRIEIGPKDVESNRVIFSRRDNNQKIEVDINEIEIRASEILKEIQENLYKKALSNRENKTQDAISIEDFGKKIDSNQGFIKSFWCGSIECEEKIKKDFGASSRCIPLNDDKIKDDSKCICCSNKATNSVIWARAY